MNKTKISFVCNDSEKWVQPYIDILKLNGRSVEKININVINDPKYSQSFKKGDIFVNFLNPSRGYVQESANLYRLGSEKGFLIVNGSSAAFYLDGGKKRQYEELKKFGINVPDTYFLENAENLMTSHLSRAKHLLSSNYNNSHSSINSNFNNNGFENKVVLKPNLGTEGKEVSLHPNIETAMQTVLKKGSTKSISSDGIVLLQQNVRESNNPFVYRAEFVDGKLLYIARIDASKGQSLCPCNLTKGANKKSPISILLKGELPVSLEKMTSFKKKCQQLIEKNDIDACSFEFSVWNDDIYVYDLNILSTYNVDAEKQAGAGCPSGHAEYAKMIEHYLQ